MHETKFLVLASRRVLSTVSVIVYHVKELLGDFLLFLVCQRCCGKYHFGEIAIDEEVNWKYHY